MVMRPGLKGIPYANMACFLLNKSPHSHGQMPRDSRAEEGRQGSFCVPGQEARRRPSGRRRYFCDLLREIWRPAVSGTGGIQDDRVAGRQKLKHSRAARLTLHPLGVDESSP